MSIKHCKLALFASVVVIVNTVQAESLLYVPLGEVNEVVKIDLDTDQVIGRIGELENAHGLSSSRNTEYLVAGSMRPMEQSQKRQAAKPANVSEAEHSAHHGASSDGKTLSLDAPSFISIIHPKHGHVMRRIAVKGLTHHTAVSPDGQMAIAVHSGIGEISVIDLLQFKVKKTVLTGMWPNYALFSNNGEKLYVSNSGAGTISEFNTKNWALLISYKVGKEPEHIVLSPDNQTLYTANKGDGTITALDLTQGEIGQVYYVGDKVHGIDISNDGRWLFATSKGEELITRINLSNGQLKSVALKPAPYHLSYITNKDKLYVSSRKLPKIWVIDPTDLSVIKSIDLGRGVAHQMVVRID